MADKLAPVLLPELPAGEELVELRRTRSIAGRQRATGRLAIVFRSTGERIVGREVLAIRRQVEKLEKAGALHRLREWLPEFLAGEEKLLRESFAPVVSALGAEVFEIASEEVGADPTLDPGGGFDAFLGAFTAGLAARHVSSSRGQLEKIVRTSPADELAAAIGTRLDEWREKRASKLARRESTRLSGAASREAYKAGGRRALRWITVGENCPICDELDGKVVGIDDAFGRAGDQFGPEDRRITLSRPMTHPPLHDGCDCQIVAE